MKTRYKQIAVALVCGGVFLNAYRPSFQHSPAVTPQESASNLSRAVAETQPVAAPQSTELSPQQISVDNSADPRDMATSPEAPLEPLVASESAQDELAPPENPYQLLMEQAEIVSEEERIAQQREGALNYLSYVGAMSEQQVVSPLSFDERADESANDEQVIPRNPYLELRNAVP